MTAAGALDCSLINSSRLMLAPHPPALQPLHLASCVAAAGLLAAPRGWRASSPLGSNSLFAGCGETSFGPAVARRQLGLLSCGDAAAAAAAAAW